MDCGKLPVFPGSIRLIRLAAQHFAQHGAVDGDFLEREAAVPVPVGAQELAHVVGEHARTRPVAGVLALVLCQRRLSIANIAPAGQTSGTTSSPSYFAEGAPLRRCEGETRPVPPLSNVNASSAQPTFSLRGQTGHGR